MKNPNKLKRVVIKEELVALTGDFTKAVILNQFIYWSERVKDFDKFIVEEKTRMEKETKELNIEKQNGWIYKTAEEMAKETMLGLSPKTMRNHIKYLVDNHWLDERNNPKYKWDRTLQYRVNIKQIQIDLFQLGYVLDEYPLQFNPMEMANLCKGQKGKMDKPKKKNHKSEKENAIPEITNKDYISKNTKNYLHNPLDCDRYCYLSEIDNEFVQSYLAIMKPYRPPHKRVKKENIDYILNAIELIRGSGFELPDWEQAVHEYFTQLPSSNDGDIIAFLSASMRYFNVDVNFELGR